MTVLYQRSVIVSLGWLVVRSIRRGAVLALNLRAGPLDHGEGATSTRSIGCSIAKSARHYGRSWTRSPSSISLLSTRPIPPHPPQSVAFGVP